MIVGWNEALARGRLVTIPDEYADLILVPALLHIDPLVFMDYPPIMRLKIRRLLGHLVGTRSLLNGSG